MTAIRWITGTPLAATITIGLFLLMNALISNDLDLPPAKPFTDITITKQIDPTPLEKIKPPKPIEEVLPPTEIQRTEPTGKPTHTIELPDDMTGLTDPVEITGPVGAPIIQVAPAYPERCRSRGATGTVLVQFDVAADGSVVNPVILQSADSCFDRTVLKAVSGWKYPPAYRNGQPIPRYGVVETFSFQLEGE